MTTFFHVVNEHVARNPVGRAIQKTRIRQALLDFALTLYYLEDGTQQSENLQAAATALAVAIRLRERAGSDDGMPVMRGAMSVIVDRSINGFCWKSADAVAIDMGMQAALSAISEASAVGVQEAWVFVAELERQAA